MAHGVVFEATAVRRSTTKQIDQRAGLKPHGWRLVADGMGCGCPPARCLSINKQQSACFIPPAHCRSRPKIREKHYAAAQVGQLRLACAHSYLLGAPDL